MIGKLIVFEGTDGCGKATQTEKLVGYAKSKGIDVDKYDFPAYNTLTGRAIKNFWTDREQFPNPHDFDPRLPILLNAGDQAYSSMSHIIGSLKEGKTVISDRFCYSNIGYAGARFEEEDRPEFYKWCENVFEPLPQPDYTFFLKIPVDISAELLNRRAIEQDRPLDFNEKKTDYLREVQKSYLQWYAKQDNVSIIDCAPYGELRSIENIHKEIADIFDNLVGEL